MKQAAIAEVPTPKKLQHELDDLSRTARSVIEHYAWLHGLAFGSGGSSELGGGDKGDIAFSDPTAAAALDRRRSAARGIVREVAAILDEAAGRIRGLDGYLRRRYGPRVRDSLNLYGPQVCSDAELEEAEAARLKRAVRGDGYGES